MKNILRYLYLLFAWLVAQQQGLAQAQTNPACNTFSTEEYYRGDVFFNYGSTSNAFNPAQRMNTTLGQTVVGESFSQNYISSFGYWSRLLLPPAAPVVSCSEGDLPDRINITWQPDPLSPSATGGFNIYRDNVLLTTVDPDARSYVDFNVIAGQFYTYTVSGKNDFGEGFKNASLGFLNPNGVVTGQIKTFSGNPVLGASVTLSPTVGTAVSLGGAASIFTPYVPTLSAPKFTVSCWVKLNSGNDNCGILDLGSSIGKNWWLHTTGAGTKGVAFSIGNGLGNTTTLSHEFEASTADDWHYIAATYNSASLLLYVDGELVETSIGAMQTGSKTFFIGNRGDNTGFLNGQVDEVRIYDRQLAQTELQMFMNRTVPANAQGLQAYWKFDEGVGSKGFDQTANKTTTYLCGASWSTDKPEVVNAGITDETGFFKIAGVNYGGGTTFTAVASKNFYFNQSLEFNGVNETYADLTDFDLPDSATITLTTKAFDFSGNQVLLSKSDGVGNVFVVCLNSGNIDLIVNGTTHSFGAFGTGFHHLALTMLQNGGSLETTLYKDAVLVGSHTFSGVPANWLGQPWKLGAKANGSGATDYFTGLMDEAAFFDSLLTLPELQTFVSIGTNPSHVSLKNYFNLNEGSGILLHDMGTSLSGNGSVQGASWSSEAAISQTLAHEFTPESRLITLNPSNTSGDGVDFTDKSTVPVSGYVRFDGSFCFADSVEIQVNGVSLSPPIYTDAEGKFIVDLEPGATVKLSPKYKNHQFFPVDWELIKVNTPVAGILFRDLTKRTIKGQITGGHCRNSIITLSDIVKIKVESLDGCYSVTKNITNSDGNFTFYNLPPKKLTIAVVQHTDPEIYNYFQLQGGTSVDLTEKNDTTDFIYYSAPGVEMTSLDTNQCGDNMLEQSGKYKVNIRVYQDYPGGRCYLDTARLKIQNLIADAPQRDTLMQGGIFKYQFKAGLPELTPPHLKTLQVTAKANNRESTAVQQAVVLGIIPRQDAFLTTSPQIPLMVVHDPPGDASFAHWEKSKQVCTTWSFETVKDDGFGFREKVSIGPNWEIASGFVGFLTKTDGDVVAEEEGGIQFTKSQTDLKSTSACVSTTEILATASDDLLVGADADVFMGGAMNMIFGVTDKLVFDTALCAFKKTISMIVVPKDFATTYIYTRYHIVNTVIPDLLALPVPDLKGVAAWREILKQDSINQAGATFDKNLSFNGGITYEYSTANENGKFNSHSMGNMVDEDWLVSVGFFANDVGASGGLQWNFHSESTTTNDTSTTNTTIAGYALSDDDPGDNFTVDVLIDKKYGTSVFRTKSGQSSCPYEKTTQPREGVSISVDKLSDVNVPENGEAVFKFTLGNISQSNDTREYLFSLIPESNPNGAVVKINGGSPLDRPFGIAAFEGQEVTVTIERGPVEHVYEDLEFAIFSECEDSRGVALGLSSIDPTFYKSVLLDVTYLEPCSRVEIGFPLQDWVLTPADGDILNVIANSYDENDSDLELIRAQYRRSQGDGAWINIAEVPKADLDPIFENIPWDTDGLKDGLYEVRTITQCFGGQNPGISHVMKGKIERTPPEIFGAPQPADGVLSAGDEISIQFTEPIRCDMLIQADFFDNNNVGLYYAETGELIDAIITCQGDKIIIVPNVANRFIENQVLRVEIDDIKDLVGNNFAHAEWEFFVDRNPVHWEGGTVKVTKQKPDFVTVTRRIVNDGAQATSFDLQGIPVWVRVYPTSGLIQPGAAEEITFEFDDILTFGNYLDTISFDAPEGVEPLIVNCRVLCESPEWDFDAAAYPQTMNFTLKLDIEGTLSTDEEDIVAAFIDGELRGTAKIRSLPTLPPLGTQYMAFLTVYGNDDDVNKPVKLEIWDASACLRYGEVLENFNFEIDNVIGTLGTPQVIHTNSMVRRDIPLRTGWNWISFNLLFPDPALNPALASLEHPQNDLIKGQSSFAEYFGTNWIGSLTALNNKNMFQFRADVPDTIQMVGALIDPAALSIPVSSGWNWIGYVPNYALPVTEALAGLAPLNGDIIKGQTAFAQYLAGYGWIGSLQFMEPPQGYQLKISTPGTLIYPANNYTGNNDAARDQSNPPVNFWNVDPGAFEYSMTLVGMLSVNGQNSTLEPHELGVFAGNELRGSATSIYVAPLDAYLFFLTAYANVSGEPLQFKLYNNATGQVSSLSEQMYFSSNLHQGSIETPVPFTLGSTGLTELTSSNYFDVQPNPFTNALTIRFECMQEQEVQLVITDATGRMVYQQKTVAAPGMNTVQWNAQEGSAGMYFVRLEGADGTMVRKVVRQ